MLVDVDRLVRAYYEERPDPSDPAQQVAFGTSGHRGSAFAGSFNEAHIVAMTEAICRYRAGRGIDGPLFLGRDTHGLSEPAFHTAVEVLAANEVEVMVDSAEGYTPTPAISHAILTWNRDHGEHLADGIVVTPSHNPPEDGGFKYNPPNGGPADTDVTGWIQDRANALRAGRHAAPPRLRGLLRRRPARGGRHGGDPPVRAQARRRPARWRQPRLLGRHRRAVRPRPHRHQRPGRPDVPVHVGRLGRQAAHGPVVQLRHGRAARPEGPLRRGLRQRPRRRPGR